MHGPVNVKSVYNLFGLLSRPTNAQHLYILISTPLAKWGDKTPWKLCGCIEICRSSYDIYIILLIY